MDNALLQDIVVIFGLSIAVLLLCHKIKIPSIVGFLFTGVIAGPHGLAVVKNIHAVETFSQIGIVLLLFSIGVEFSLKRVFRYKRYFLLGGSLQVVLTALAGFCIAEFLGRPAGESWFLGFLLSLSSTAIVFRLIESRSESNSSQGIFSTSVLIFQDIIVIPMMLFVPYLAGTERLVQISVWSLLLKGICLIVLVLVLATKIVPKLFYIITKTRNRELFLLSVLAICFSVAWLSDAMGLSLAIGAFLAGLIISESEYSHQALGDVLPLQDVFTSLFFVSIGMLLDIHFVVEHAPLILCMTFGVMLLKMFIVTFTGIVIGIPLRTVLLAAFALCQIGEFSFVLAKYGQEYGLGTEYYYQLFLAITLFSMSFTPFLLQVSHFFVDALMHLPLPAKIKAGLKPLQHQEERPMCEHVVIVGYGICGKNVATSCKMRGIPYLIVEMNSETVAIESKRDEPIMFGDATHEIVLKHAQIKTAKVIAIAINDPRAVLRIISEVRKLNSSIYIICRTHYIGESNVMYTHGANDVIADEFGTSLEMFSRVLHQLQVPYSEIEEVVEHIRDQNENQKYA